MSLRGVSRTAGEAGLDSWSVDSGVDVNVIVSVTMRRVCVCCS